MSYSKPASLCDIFHGMTHAILMRGYTTDFNNSTTPQYFSYCCNGIATDTSLNNCRF